MNELAYQDVARRDPALPGLRHLLAPQEIAFAFGDELPPDRIRISQVVYQPHRYALVTYRWEGPDGPHWAYGKTTRDAHLPAAWRWLARLRGWAGACGNREAAITLRTFPDDPLLPIHRLIGRSPAVGRWRLAPQEPLPDEIQRLASNRAVPTWHIRDYQPERSCVLDLCIDQRAVAQARVHSHRDHVAATLLAQLVEPREVLDVLPLVGEDRRTYCLWFLLPPSLTAGSLAAPRDTLQAQMTLLGRALRELHCQSVPEIPWASSAESTYRHRQQAERCARLLPRRAHRAVRLLERLEGGLAVLPARYVSCHGDVRWAQLLFGRERVVFSDYHRARYDHPLSDLGSILADHWIALGCQSPHSGQLDPAAAQAALCAGYRPPYKQTDRLLALFTARALWRRLTEPFEQNLCQWPLRIEQRLEQIEILLAGNRLWRHPRSACDPPRMCQRSVKNSS